MNKIIKDNKGFSLIELLVGIAILSIIVAPLLSNFIVSANTYAKSRKIGEATTAAQNISENLREVEVSELLSASFNFMGQIVAPSSATIPTDNGYTIEFELDDLISGTSSFDAVVRLEAGKVNDTTDSTLYEVINSQEIIDFSSMDAMFAQNKLVLGYGYDRLENGETDLKDIQNINDITDSGDPDMISYRNAETLFISNIEILQGVTVEQIVRDGKGIIDYYTLVGDSTIHDVTLDKYRTIIIEIDNIGVDDASNTNDQERHANNIITADIIYEYEYSFTVGTGAQVVTYEFNKITNPLDGFRFVYDLLNNGYDVGAKNGVYPTLFVLYHPFYNNKIIDETITIKNNADTGDTRLERLPVSIYLIKQKDPNSSATQQGNLDLDYSPLIELVQPYSATEPTQHVRIYSNAGQQFSDSGIVGFDPIRDDTTQFAWYNGPGVYYTAPWGESLPTDASLTPTSSDIKETEQAYRMYEVTIDIYDGTSLIHTLTTSKLA